MYFRLQPREGTRYPLRRRLGGLQGRSGRCGEEKNSLPLPGFEPQIVLGVLQFSYLLSHSGLSQLMKLSHASFCNNPEAVGKSCQCQYRTRYHCVWSPLIRLVEDVFNTLKAF